MIIPAGIGECRRAPMAGDRSRPRRPRACLQRLQPEQDTADVDHGEIVGGTLFVAGCHSPGLLEAIDQPLDPVSLAVGVAVEIRLPWLVGAGRDDRSDASLAQAATRRWAAVALVARHLARAQTWTAAPVAANGTLIEQGFRRDLLVALTAGEHDRDGLAAAFGPQVQLGRKPTLAAPQRLGLVLASGKARLAAGAGGV